MAWPFLFSYDDFMYARQPLPPVTFSPDQVAAVKLSLAGNGLSTDGSDSVLMARWKLHQQGVNNQHSSHLHYLVVVDFEATCTGGMVGLEVQEIIEFGAILIDVRQRKLVSEFRSYCKPRLTTALQQFCKDLTGISQETVDRAPPFPDVLKEFHHWLHKNGLLTRNNNWCIVTHGYADLRVFFHQTCQANQIEYPCYAKAFTDFKAMFFWHYQHADKTRGRLNLNQMLNELGLVFEGKPHSAVDDARNVARMCLIMLQDGIDFVGTEVVVPDKMDPKKPFCCQSQRVNRAQWIQVNAAAMEQLQKQNLGI